MSPITLSHSTYASVHLSVSLQPRTPLEQQVAALLRGSDNVVQDAETCELTPAEQRALRAMDLQQVLM